MNSPVLLVALTATLMGSTVLLIPPEKAYATQPLTVYVGYSGGPYYEKHAFSVNELEALASPYFYAYSAIDKKPSLVKYAAWGVPLETIFSNAVDSSVGTSVNQQALWRLAFDTDDDYKPDDGIYGNNRWYWDYYNNYVSGHVLNTATTPRYYFPDFDKYFDFAQTSIIESKQSELIESRMRVPSLLALKYIKERIYSEEDWRYLDSRLDSNNVPGSLSNVGSVDERNRLLFGQTTPSEQEVENELHSITGLYCIYHGRAKVTLDTSEITGSIGDTVQVRATIEADDDLIKQEGPKDVVWTSADESVATVVSNGDGTASVTIHGKGDVQITAAYGQSSSSEFKTNTSLNVSGPGGSGHRGEGEGEGKNYGEGDGEQGPGTKGEGEGESGSGGDAGHAGDSTEGSLDGDNTYSSGAGNELTETFQDGGQNVSSAKRNVAVTKSQSEGEQVASSKGNEIKPVYTSVPAGARPVALGVVVSQESAAASSSAGEAGFTEERVVEAVPKLYRVEQQEQEKQAQQEQEKQAHLQAPWEYLVPLLILMVASALAQVVYFQRSKDRRFKQTTHAIAHSHTERNDDRGGSVVVG